MSKSNETKNKILNSAIDIISEKGFSATTTSEIAKNAGYSEATLFKYFKTKDALLKHIVLKSTSLFYDEINFSDIDSLIEEYKDLSKVFLLKDLIKSKIHFIEKNTKLLKLLLQESFFSKEIENIFSKRILEKTLSIFHHLIEIIEKDDKNIKINSVEATSNLLIGSIIGILLNYYFCLNENIDFNLEDEVDKIIKIIFDR